MHCPRFLQGFGKQGESAEKKIRMVNLKKKIIIVLLNKKYGGWLILLYILTNSILQLLHLFFLH